MHIDSFIAETDRVLDELESIAQSGVSNATFWNRYLSSLLTLVGAHGASLLMYAQEQLVPLAHVGADPRSQISELSEHLMSGRRAPNFWGGTPQLPWRALALAPTRREETRENPRGWLLLSFTEELDASSKEGVGAISEAFVEILETRDNARRERVVRRMWDDVKVGSEQLTQAGSVQELNRILVDQLVRLCSASRVSLVSVSGTGVNQCSMVATSGMQSIDYQSQTVQAIQRVAKDASVRREPSIAMSPTMPAFASEVVQNSKEQGESVDAPKLQNDGLFENRLVFQWTRHGAAERRNQATHWLVLEWASREELADSLPDAAASFSILNTVWTQQNRWLQLPLRSRRWVMRREHALGAFDAWKKYLRLVATALVVGGLVWGAFYPYPMTIEATSLLEPVERANIHAPTDGYLVELYARDGDKVTKGQKLAKLRSPQLELQIEEILGQVRAMAEKRNGLQVAINQLSSASENTTATQTRISTDLLVLGIQEKHAKDKLAFLNRESEKLVLEAAIDGVLVSTDLKRELENRPVRRGDPLFRIMDIDGEWQLRIDLLDRDTAYVHAHYAGNHNSLSYVFDSLPTERFYANVKQFAIVNENGPDQGSVQQVFASVQKEDALRAHAGATARVKFACGTKSFWFVWSRPLVEFLQRRFWLSVGTPE